MYLPSGDQVGLLTNQRRSRETCFGFFPSTSIVQMFHRPSRSLANAIRLPSGLKRGCMSKAGPLGDPRRGRGAAAADRHHVDVAEQVEDDPLAVRADVHVHPRAFGRVERQLRRRPEVGGDVPLLLSARGFCWRVSGCSSSDAGRSERARVRHVIVVTSPSGSVDGVMADVRLSRLRHRYQLATERYGRQASPSLRIRSGVGFLRRRTPSGSR